MRRTIFLLAILCSCRSVEEERVHHTVGRLDENENAYFELIARGPTIRPQLEELYREDWDERRVRLDQILWALDVMEGVGIGADLQGGRLSFWSRRKPKGDTEWDVPVAVDSGGTAVPICRDRGVLLFATEYPGQEEPGSAPPPRSPNAFVLGCPALALALVRGTVRLRLPKGRWLTVPFELRNFR